METNTVSAMPRPAQRPPQFVPPPTANRAQNANRMPTPGTSDGDDNNIHCGCNKQAILLTVRKQTANFGKPFKNIILSPLRFRVNNETSITANLIKVEQATSRSAGPPCRAYSVACRSKVQEIRDRKRGAL